MATRVQKKRRSFVQHSRDHHQEAAGRPTCLQTHSKRSFANTKNLQQKQNHRNLFEEITHQRGIMDIPELQEPACALRRIGTRTINEDNSCCRCTRNKRRRLAFCCSSVAIEGTSWWDVRKAQDSQAASMAWWSRPPTRKAQGIPGWYRDICRSIQTKAGPFWKRNAPSLR